MKRLLLPLLAALALPNSVEANWFGKYPSEREAMYACTKWKLKGGRYEGTVTYKRYCETESSTRQVLGINDWDGKVEKRYKF